MKIKNLLIILSSISFVLFVWYGFLYEPYPKERYNFIGMSRIEVLEWLNLHKDTDGRILIQIGSCDFYYPDIEKFKRDENVMESNEWGIGEIRLRLGTRLYYSLIFKNGKVIKQTDYTMSDW